MIARICPPSSEAQHTNAALQDRTRLTTMPRRWFVNDDKSTTHFILTTSSADNDDDNDFVSNYI